MSEVEYEVEEKVEIDEPKMYRVIMHNDNTTTFEFVIAVLMQIFQKSYNESENIAWHIHENGNAVVAIYSFEVAEQKVEDATDAASMANYPLKVTMEED